MSNHLHWTGTLIRSLYNRGVRHAIISPGSRSTPITLAAAIHPGFKKKIILDERSAAFIALGIAKASGFPAILICTSGTALANYFPAVVEARQSGVPLIILSADRPPHLRSIGSSQTIDQIKIFSDYTFFSHDTGEPVDGETDLKRIEYLGKQAVSIAMEQKGPVHINLPFRKPLEPDQQTLATETEKSLIQFEQLKHNQHTPFYEKTVNPGSEFNSLLNQSKKPLIICGPADPHDSHNHQIQSLSKRLHAPVIVEPGSAGSVLDCSIHRYEQFLRDPKQNHSLKPDLIIRFGNQPFTSSVNIALKKWVDVPLIHFHNRMDTQDHALSVTHTIHISGGDMLDLSGVNLKNTPEWLEDWRYAESNAEAVLQRSLNETGTLTDGHVIQHVSSQFNENWNLMISNSFTVRDMALFGKGAAHYRQFVNRGAAGIDGIVSTASGILAESGKPTCVLTGDLAFLHDSNSLLSLNGLDEAPLVIVVINNGGGSIFRMLPVYHSDTLKIPEKIFETYFETPQNTGIQKLAEASSIAYKRITDVKGLGDFKLDRISEHTLIEYVTDADKSMILRKQLWDG